MATEPRPPRLITALALMLLAAIALGRYDTRTTAEQQQTQVDERRLEVEQAAEERERCALAIDAYKQQHTYPFDTPSGQVVWKMPAECTDVIR